MRRWLRFSVVAFLLAPGLAMAHTGVGDASSFGHGFMHPLTGLDHMLALVAVGMFAANLGGTAVLTLPLTFMALMGLGGVTGLAGWHLPLVETGIAASVLVLGLAIAFKIQASVPAAMLLVGTFAIFHGFAHGAEMPPSMSGAQYGTGFLVATGLLHGIGIGAGKFVTACAPNLLRAIGAAFALAGASLLAGTF